MVYQAGLDFFSTLSYSAIIGNSTITDTYLFGHINVSSNTQPVNFNQVGCNILGVFSMTPSTFNYYVNKILFGTGSMDSSLNGSTIKNYGVYQIICNFTVQVNPVSASYNGIFSIGGSQCLTSTSQLNFGCCWSFNNQMYNASYNNVFCGQLTYIYNFYGTTPLYMAAYLNSVGIIYNSSYQIVRIA